VFEPARITNSFELQRKKFGHTKITTSKNDEFYTPTYAITPILKYLKPASTIWCPFDTEESHYVKLFKEKGFNVLYSHQQGGEDFFDVCNKYGTQADYIISNPPYSIKGEVFERLFELNKPFAMLVGATAIFEGKRYKIFKDKTFEIMYFSHRVSYFENYSETKPSIHPRFSSIYICKNILPSNIVFEDINATSQKLRNKQKLFK